jgi:hypothetical protein
VLGASRRALRRPPPRSRPRSAHHLRCRRQRRRQPTCWRSSRCPASPTIGWSMRICGQRFLSTRSEPGGHRPPAAHELLRTAAARPDADFDFPAHRGQRSAGEVDVVATISPATSCQDLRRGRRLVVRPALTFIETPRARPRRGPAPARGSPKKRIPAETAARRSPCRRGAIAHGRSDTPPQERSHARGSIRPPTAGAARRAIAARAKPASRRAPLSRRGSVPRHVP